MKTLTANIEETLYDWFEQHGLALKKFSVERYKTTDEPRLYFAKGEFEPVCFDKENDGSVFTLLYQMELALKDERFEKTALFFDTDTTFRIV